MVLPEISASLEAILAAVFVFGLLIFAHELGHFICAKLTGMRVDEFSIGFGPKLVGFKYGETYYSLRIIPLGGYNKIAGMDPEEEEDERSFNRRPLAARALTIFGGSFMNFLLPVLLLTITYTFAGLDQPSEENIIGQVVAGNPAEQAGLQPGDRILAIDGEAVDRWQDTVVRIHRSAGKQMIFTVQRNAQELAITVTPVYDPEVQRGLIGIGPQIMHTELTTGQSVSYAVEHTFFTLREMLNQIGSMLTGKSSADVSGPIGVAQMSAKVAQLGFIPLLQFAAFLSLNLGLLNLLPLPALDGGHIVLLIMEGIRRKPLKKTTLYTIQMIGFALIVTLALVATYNDLMRNFKIF
ncbi:MAG TPA: RIP metalloprotease RseP [Negativicutes bacterium]|nr:RIP metalloprotease RseP [Negativicutes bacterium]